MQKYIDQYRGGLLNDVIPFWMKNSRDYQPGGYFTCLDQYGNVLDTQYGWDPKHGGTFYFMDVKGNRPQQLEHAGIYP
ncbi:MAG: hypothetical protein ABIN80_10480 [Dyadobacter sp.]|uniref:hypothetical protein n=1 Tax=Dyadobacter sp. TaxID=1914288 RepID=UPI0032636E78